MLKALPITYFMELEIRIKWKSYPDYRSKLQEGIENIRGTNDSARFKASSFNLVAAIKGDMTQ